MAAGSLPRYDLFRTNQRGDVGVHAPRRFGEPVVVLERVGRDADGLEPLRHGDPHYGHPHRGERPQHALHVAAFEVDPWPRRRRFRQREQRGDRPRLEQPERAVPVERELDVLGRARALLQPVPGLAQLLELRRTQASTGTRGLPLAVQDVVVGGDATVHDDVPETGDGVGHHLGPRTGDRVGGEQHPGGDRVDHPLDHDTHPHPIAGDVVGRAIGDRPLARERVPAPVHRVDQRLGAADVQQRLVLAREAGVRQVLRGRTGPDRDRACPESLVGLDDLPAELVGKRTGRRPDDIVRDRGDAEALGHPLARPDHLVESSGLATDERDRAGAHLAEPDDGGRPESGRSPRVIPPPLEKKGSPAVPGTREAAPPAPRWPRRRASSAVSTRAPAPTAAASTHSTDRHVGRRPLAQRART
jgi:hypothetical protein